MGSAQHAGDVPPTPDAELLDEVEQLRDELDLLRQELAKARRSEEEAQEKLGKQRRGRLKAERRSEVLAKSLSEALLSQSRGQQHKGRLRSGVPKDGPTPAEWAQVLLLRGSQHFWPGWYLRTNPEVAELGVEPALHFLRTGWKEGRDPSPNFSLRRHAAQHPEVVKHGLNPLLHAIETGTTPAVKQRRGKYDT